MNAISVIKECRNLISLGELPKSLSLFIQHKNLFDSDTNDEIILISSQFEDYQKNKRLGLLNTEDDYMISAKITFSILQIFNHLTRIFDSTEVKSIASSSIKSDTIEIIQNKILWSFREIPRKFPNSIDLSNNRISPAIIEHEYIINRKSINDKIFLHCFSGSVPLIDSVCLNLPFQVEPVGKNETNGFAKWQMKIDISHSPVDTPFPIFIRMIYWNIYKPEDIGGWFCHKIKDYKESSFRIEAILPDWKPFISIKRIVRESGYANEEIELRDNINFNSNIEKTRVVWVNDNVKFGYEYYLRWEW